MSIFKKTALAAGLALAMGAAPAYAATVASQFFNGFQLLSDNNAELLINGDGGNDTTLDVGDTLFGTFNIQTVEQGVTTRQFGANGVNEFTGIFAIKVLTKSEAGQPLGSGPGVCASLHCWTFGVSDAAIPVLGDLTLSQFTGVAGTLIQTWDDPTVDYVREAVSLQTAVDSATGGSKFFTLGFGANGFWSARADTDDVSEIGATPLPEAGGFFNAGLNFIANDSGLTFGVVNCNDRELSVQKQVGTCGSGSLLGTDGVETPFDSYSNLDFTINVQRVPEPGTLGLLGAALFGLGAGLRRRGKRA